MSRHRRRCTRQRRQGHRFLLGRHRHRLPPGPGRRPRRCCLRGRRRLRHPRGPRLRHPHGPRSPVPASAVAASAAVTISVPVGVASSTASIGTDTIPNTKKINEEI